MTTQMLLSLLGGAGFLAGVAALLQFLNTRKSTRDKSGADAYVAWRSFMTGAVDDAARLNADLISDRDRLRTVRAFLIDLVQELIATARPLGAAPEDCDRFSDRLDEIRAL